MSTPLDIPAADLQFTFVRAAGPGGQNVNKVASAAQLRFDLAGTAVLDYPVKVRLRALAGRRLTSEGAILIIARNHRTQEANRREALTRLQALIAQARIVPKRRVATRPTRSSQQRRIDTKTQHKRTKQLRGRLHGHEDG